MKSFGITAAVLFSFLLAGCSHHDQKVKSDAEDLIEEAHRQMEKQRALDAYHRSPEYKEKVYQQLKHGMLGNTKKPEKVIP